MKLLSWKKYLTFNLSGPYGTHYDDHYDPRGSIGRRSAGSIKNVNSSSPPPPVSFKNMKFILKISKTNDLFYFVYSHLLEITKLATLLSTIPKKAMKFLKQSVIVTMDHEEIMEVCFC